MKLNKHGKAGTNVIEMEFSIPAEEFRQAISSVYKREAKKYNIPGFRKGRAPRNLIEKMFGEDVFYYDAANELFPEAYENAVKETAIEPVARPNAEIISASASEGAVLKVSVVVKPEVKLSTYKGLEATRTVEKADDAQVEEELSRMQERNSRILTREGVAEDGDIATIDYDGSVDGVPFDGGKDEGHKLTLGSGAFIPGFEEQVVGHKAGDEFDVNVTFPSEYHAEELAGKNAVFKVKLHEVQYKELPALDDDFATEVSEYDTLQELKDSIRNDKQEHLERQADELVENALVEKIAEGMEAEIPEEMYEGRMDEMVQDFAFRLGQQGLDLKTYMQYTGMDIEAFRGGFREQAEKQVKARLALEAVIKLENLVASDEEVDAEIDRIAEQYKMEPQQVRDMMPADEVQKDLAARKALDFIRENAKITEGEPKEEAKPKKESKKKEK